ncbi:Hypothetical predicted protein, partial [Olea europaea subsp. europaea]
TVFLKTFRFAIEDAFPTALRVLIQLGKGKIKKRKMRMRDLLSIYLQRSSCKDMSSILREFGHD